MKKRVKVFEAGNYPQGNYPIDRVKKIFESTKQLVQGIFIHSRHWKEEGKEPVNCGEFSNFEVDNGRVYADLTLNDEGVSFFEKGIFKGISVEIIQDTLDKIALLPLGVNPAIAGAEFEGKDSFYIDNIEFEEIEEGGVQMTLEEVKEFLKTAGIGDKIELMSSIVGSLSEADTRAARAMAFEFAEKSEITVEEFAEKKGFDVEVKEKAKPKTEAEIRAELIAEFEAKDKAKTELQEFETMLSKKVLPAHQEAYRMAFKASQGKTDLIEFEEGKEKTTETTYLTEKVKGMADLNLTEEFAKKEAGENLTEDEKAAKEIADIANGGGL